MSIPLVSPGAGDLSQRAEPVVLALGRRARGLWRDLVTGRRRIDAEPSDPTADAAHVRALAWRVRDSQPGFASDLLAAADRHERQFGVDR